MAGRRLFRDLGDEMLATIGELLSSAPLTNDKSFTELILSRFHSGPGLLDVEELGDPPKGKHFKHTTTNTEASGRKDGEASDDDYDLPSDEEVHDSEDEDDDDIFFDSGEENKILEFLNGLNAEIGKKYSLDQEMAEISVLRPGVSPYDHQTTAAAAILRAREYPFKGLILADPPGLGKTLPSLMAIASAERTGRGPSLIVAPNSCCRQWVSEAKRFLQEPIRILLLLDEEVSPVELFTYDIVVTPYSRVTAEFSRLLRYERRVDKYTDMLSERPKRPHLSLLSSFYNPDIKPWGPFLILDEAHNVKNPRTHGHAAVSMLRESFEACIMLSATPFDNTWRDGFGLLRFLQNHPVTTSAAYINAFSEPLERHMQRRRSPAGRYMIRIIQMFDACVLRRPQATINGLLTPIQIDIVEFNLPDEELSQSNAFFDHFKELIRKRKRGRNAAGQQGKAALAALIKAQQIACHQGLLAVLRLEEKMLIQGLDHAAPSQDLELDQDGRHELQTWLDRLEIEDRWHSARVDTIMRTVEQHQQKRPQDAIIIIDESVLFLCIIEIACRNLQPDTNVFTYDGRLHVTERDSVLQRFKEAEHPKLLLMSRAAGGVGLNVQSANVIVQCNPWWKQSWQDQAIGRVHRPGQTKPVFVYKICATGCQVEEHKVQRSGEKASISQTILNAITREDWAAPRARTCY